jgi:hypothetical protein
MNVFLLMNVCFFDAPPHSLKDLNANLKMKITKEEGVGVHSLACNISRAEGCVGAPTWGLR